MQKEKIIILLTVLVDVIGLGIIIPTLPFYVESFGAAPFIITLLFAVFSLFAFLSAPILGALSDKIGRRPILILSIISTAIGWFVFASANSIWILFLGRIIDGAAAGNFPIAQSYLADIARDNKERTANLGVIGAVFGIGLIIGPMLGAILSSISHSFPFWFAGGLAAVNAIAAIIFLPESHKKRDFSKKIGINPLSPIIKAFGDNQALKSRYLAWFLFGFAVAAQQSIFALFLDHAFGFKATSTGFIFSAMGVLMVINQGFLLKNFWLKKFNESKLEIWLYLLFGLNFVFTSIPILSLFIFGLFISILFQPVLRVIVSSRVAELAGHERRGEILGIMSSILSASMVISPILSGFFFHIWESLPFIISAFSMIAAFFVMKRCPKIPEYTQEKEIITSEAL